MSTYEEIKGKDMIFHRDQAAWFCSDIVNSYPTLQDSTTIISLLSNAFVLHLFDSFYMLSSVLVN